MKSKQFLLSCISFYQKRVGSVKKPSCVFYPTCSNYAKEAILKYGAKRGAKLALLRILRCHPWQKNHFDPVK